MIMPIDRLFHYTLRLNKYFEIGGVSKEPVLETMEMHPQPIIIRPTKYHQHIKSIKNYNGYMLQNMNYISSKCSKSYIAF